MFLGGGGFFVGEKVLGFNGSSYDVMDLFYI